MGCVYEPITDDEHQAEPLAIVVCGGGGGTHDNWPAGMKPRAPPLETQDHIMGFYLHQQNKAPVIGHRFTFQQPRPPAPAPLPAPIGLWGGFQLTQSHTLE